MPAKLSVALRFIVGILFFAVCAALKKPIVGDDWINLFNGKNLDGWIVKIHHHEPGVNWGNTFRAEDGVIKVRYDQYGDFNDQFAHLYYQQPFSHFHLKLEYSFHRSVAKRSTLVYYAE
jgi:hypothetical protein